MADDRTETFPKVEALDVTLHDDGSVTISQTPSYLNGEEQSVDVDRVQLDWLVSVLADHLKQHAVGA